MSADEEIMQELRDEGLTEETPEPTPEEPGAEAPAEEASGEEPAGEVEEPESEEAAAEEPEPEPEPVAAKDDPRDAAIAEMRAELAELKKERLSERAKQPVDPETDAEAALLARDPETMSPKDFVAYNRALVNREVRRIQAEAESIGRRAASQTAARALLSTTTVGDGFDYDTIVNKHVKAIAETVPEFGAFMDKLADRATAEYTLGLVLEVQARADNDPVKAAKLIRSALTGEARGAKRAITRVSDGLKRGAARVKNGPGGVGGRSSKLTAKEVWDMDDAAFDELERRGMH